MRTSTGNRSPVPPPAIAKRSSGALQSGRSRQFALKLHRRLSGRHVKRLVCRSGSRMDADEALARHLQVRQPCRHGCDCALLHVRTCAECACRIVCATSWKSTSAKVEEDAETARWHQQQQPAERDFTAALQRGVRTILQVDLATVNTVSVMYYCATTMSTHAFLICYVKCVCAPHDKGRQDDLCPSRVKHARICNSNRPLHVTLQYEQPGVQDKARSAMPLAQLRAGAADAAALSAAMREAPPAAEQDELAQQLLTWFKTRFFTWVRRFGFQHPIQMVLYWVVDLMSAAWRCSPAVRRPPSGGEDVTVRNTACTGLRSRRDAITHWIVLKIGPPHAGGQTGVSRVRQPRDARHRRGGADAAGGGGRRRPHRGVPLHRLHGLRQVPSTVEILLK